MVLKPVLAIADQNLFKIWIQPHIKNKKINYTISPYDWHLHSHEPQ